MGLLNFLAKPTLLHLSEGSFTVDRHGSVVVSTLPHSFPKSLVAEISRNVLAVFRSAQDAQLPLSELIVHYPALKITAREMRGGALVFLSPRGLTSAPN